MEESTNWWTIDKVYRGYLLEKYNSKIENNINMDPKRSECGHQSPA